VRGLYAIIDCDFLAKRGVAPLAQLERLLEATPAAIQLRAKSAGAREALALARAMAPACRARGVPFFMNDRPDLALLAESAGVHLGQLDLPVREVRRLAPRLRIGVSTHRLEEVEQALAEAPDYVAFGPVFSTQSKQDPEPVVGLGLLQQAAQRCRRAGVPLVAIGGIDQARAAEVAQHADAAAVISALLPSGGLAEVAAAARNLHLALGGALRASAGGGKGQP
jgi:thiamine-phosphate pyrophosphorylase